MMIPLVQIKNIKKNFSLRQGTLKALDDLTFDIYPGETLGLVGESGSGKSTLGKILLNLETPSDGKIYYIEKNLHKLKGQQQKEIRKEIQVIFQDPYASLNPKMTVDEILKEPFEIHNIPFSKETIDQLLTLVSLPPSCKNRFSYELSGGQRQRIGIARALALKPKFIVCDEPISALDVSVGAQILNLLKKLQKELGLTILFIAHDLRAVRYLSSRVAVMYLGQLMELGSVEDLYESPLHPYTKALLSAIPIPDPILEKSRIKILLEGEIPSPLNPPKGCVFASRCPQAKDLCHKTRPSWREVSPGRFTSCHFT